MHKKILSHLICPDGYVMVRKDHVGERAGGGVAVICRNDWTIKPLNVKEDFDSETVWCKITTHNSEYYVACVYHLPDPINNANDLLEFISDFVIRSC